MVWKEQRCVCIVCVREEEMSPTIMFFFKWCLVRAACEPRLVSVRARC